VGQSSWAVQPPTGRQPVSPLIRQSVKIGTTRTDCQSPAWREQLFVWRRMVGEPPQMSFSLQVAAAMRHPLLPVSIGGIDGHRNAAEIDYRMLDGSTDTERIVASVYYEEPAADVGAALWVGDYLAPYILVVPPQKVLDDATLDF